MRLDGGGGHDEYGCSLLLMGVFFVLAPVLLCSPWTLLADALAHSRWSEPADGLAVRCETAAAANDGWELREYRVFFEFSAPSGRVVRCVNHVTGTDAVPGLRDGGYDARGDAVRDIAVPVSYVPAAPAWAVLASGRLTRARGLALVFGCLLPFVFCIAIGVSYAGFRRFRWLLREGTVTEAKVDKVRSSLSRGGRRHYTVVFRFEGRDGVVRTVRRGMREELGGTMEACADAGIPVRILHHPDLPETVVVLAWQADAGGGIE